MPAFSRIAIVGDGNVGTALTQGLTRAGHEVQAVGREPGRVKELAQWGEVVVLAVPFAERQNALREMGDAIQGKVLVDVTNAVGKEGYVGNLQKSGAEEVQEWARGARVVKAFNTVFAQNMGTGQVHGERISAFVAADDEGAKRRVLQLAEGIGFDPVDAGPLKNARWLEPAAMLNMQLGYGAGLGPSIGLKLVHEGSRAASAERQGQRLSGTR